MLGDRALATDASKVVGSYRVSYVHGVGGGTFTIVPETVTFSALGGFQTLLQGITYINSTDNPTDGNRSMTVVVTDAGYDNGAGVAGEASSTLTTATINVDPVNDQPQIGRAHV